MSGLLPPELARAMRHCFREVERMLDADGRAGGVLDKPSSSSAPEEGRFPAGTVLGRYRIVGLLGKGGMGEVFRIAPG